MQTQAKGPAQLYFCSLLGDSSLAKEKWGRGRKARPQEIHFLHPIAKSGTQNFHEQTLKSRRKNEGLERWLSG